MTSHDCGKHGFQHKNLLRRILIGLAISIPIITAIILIIVFSIRPIKPDFTIQDATLHTFNISTNPSLLTSTFQVTLIAQNPNDHASIIYDNLGVYATYHDQQITLTTRFEQSVYQGHNEVNVWSPFLYGNLVPIAPYNAIALTQDQNLLQVVDLVIVMNGYVRFKVGAITHGRYYLNVKCPARMTFGSRSTGVLVGNAVKYQLVERCSVSV